MENFLDKINIDFEIMGIFEKEDVQRIKIKIFEQNVWKIRENIPPIIDWIMYSEDVFSGEKNILEFVLKKIPKSEIEPHFSNYLREEFQRASYKKMTIEFRFVEEFDEHKFNINYSADGGIDIELDR